MIKFSINILVLAFLFFGLISCRRTDNWCYTHKFAFQNSSHSADTFYGFTELDSALACAKAHKKNLLLAFNNCNVSSVSNLEWKTLSLFTNMNFIQDNFILVSLCKDNPKKLEDSSRIEIIEGASWEIKTAGDKNSVLEVKLMRSNASIAFCFIDTNVIRYGRTLNYTKDKDEVRDFIKSGLDY